MMMIGRSVPEAAHIWRVIEVAFHNVTVWKHSVVPNLIAAIVTSVFSFGFVAPKFAPVIVMSSFGATLSCGAMPGDVATEHAAGVAHAMLVMIGAMKQTKSAIRMPGYFVAAATLTFVVSKEPPGAVEEVIVIECVELDVVKHGVVHVILFSLMT